MKELKKSNRNYVGARVRKGYMNVTAGLRRKMGVANTACNLRVFISEDEIGLKVDPEGPFKMTHSLTCQGTVSVYGRGVKEGKYIFNRCEDDLFILKRYEV